MQDAFGDAASTSADGGRAAAASAATLIALLN